jgi:hypothetical protein
MDVTRQRRGVRDFRFLGAWGMVSKGITGENARRTDDFCERGDDAFVDGFPRAGVRVRKVSIDGAASASYEYCVLRREVRAYRLLHTSISSMSSVRARFGKRPSELPQR